MYRNFPVNQAWEDGLILMDKPLTWTSFNVVKKVRFLLQGKKTGHAGTLDPLASGLVILCTGKATKAIESIQDLGKVYTGTIVLGGTTASYDLESPIIPTPNAQIPTENEIIIAVQRFEGLIEQIPPIFSAVKIDGKRAYEYARGGESVEIKKRKVHIESFKVTDIRNQEIDFEVKCSKGTYIRSLANDLGQALGCGAYLSRLCRTQIGEFTLENAFSIVDFETLANKK
jgi:tRNA pseudouridine55 synthase